MKIFQMILYSHVPIIAPICILIALILMINEIGPSAIAGLGLMILMIPIQIWIGKKMNMISRQILVFTDQRTKLMNEIINGIRVVKLYAWEQSFTEKLQYIRQLELQKLKVNKKKTNINNK
jgi:ABC-type multidrug transport system fused ATPase/permease subunit